MPTIKTQQQASRKTRRGGGTGIRVALVLALITVLVVRAGGPAHLAHDVVQLALAVLEATACLAASVVVLAGAALAVRFTVLRWRDRTVHLVTDASWPRYAPTTGGDGHA
jgi:hypothetical protein